MIFYDEFYFDLDVSLNFSVDLIDHRRLTYVLYIIEKVALAYSFEYSMLRFRISLYYSWLL